MIIPAIKIDDHIQTGYNHAEAIRTAPRHLDLDKRQAGFLVDGEFMDRSKAFEVALERGLVEDSYKNAMSLSSYMLKRN